MNAKALTQEMETFWHQQARALLTWSKPWDNVLSGDFHAGKVRWFDGGELNVSENCLDRHLPELGDKVAIIWEGDSVDDHATLTFKQLHQQVCLMANSLKKLGIAKGDKVAIYMPMIPEAAIAMLACARIGAVHTVVFAGFSAHALRQRLVAADCQLVITADGYQRGGKHYLLKQDADKACEGLPIRKLVVKCLGNEVSWQSDFDHWWHTLKEEVDDICAPEPMGAEDPLFILYTSGSTGQPKGLVHTTGGYLLQAAFSHRQVFACQANDIFWCTADVGWITGHSYVVYGPLCNGVTTLMFAGVPNWPDPSRFWQVVDKHQVSVFYTAPTAIRALMREGNEWLSQSSRHSLRLMGSVGEPINPEVWQWYHQHVGQSRCPIVDTWWQTETGAIMVSDQPPYHHQNPGAASIPLPGIEPVILDKHFKEIVGTKEGALAIKTPWPSMARTIAKDHPRYRQTYFKDGYYITGDGAYRDEGGDIHLTGRMDDVLNVAGHRLGSAEIESALVLHPDVAEAAVVAIPDDIKGEAVCAFVALQKGVTASDDLFSALRALVVAEIGAIAKPAKIHWVPDLPKTRSGKIMRRILRKLVTEDITNKESLGDVSTLANPDVVEKLMAANLK
ncbi:acetate--CoA ligase [Legionella sp. W05-934-2]|uniref:acetate--CoA ligase n=1 Tax=Legionella sp. W05-934-2 TaxID=1198649 RepID=UPI00346341D3